MTVVDTSVLSLAFRRRRRLDVEPPAVRALRRMVIEDAPVMIPGIVMQETLSGVRSDDQFLRLNRLLEAFPVLIADLGHHVAAARISNTCRRRGIIASAVDCLIAALTISRNASLLTLDADFSKIATLCDLRLLPIEEAPAEGSRRGLSWRTP